MKTENMTPTEQKRQNSLHTVLGLALLLLSAVLIVNLIRHFPSRVTLQTVVNLLGILLFCGVGTALLGGVLGHACKTRKHREKQEDSVHGKRQ